MRRVSSSRRPADGRVLSSVVKLNTLCGACQSTCGHHHTANKHGVGNRMAFLAATTQVQKLSSPVCMRLATSKQLPPPVVRHSLGFLASGWTVATRLEAANGQRPACAASPAGSCAAAARLRHPFVVLVVSILEWMQCVPAVERSRLQTSQNSPYPFRTWASRFAHVLMHLPSNHTIDSDQQGQTKTPTAPLLQLCQMIQRATPGL